jgi:hypothetical protein
MRLPIPICGAVWRFLGAYSDGERAMNTRQAIRYGEPDPGEELRIAYARRDDFERRYPGLEDRYDRTHR